MVQARRGLIATQGRPWAEYGKSGKPISKNQLAKRLKRFKIVPDSVRLWDKTLKPVSGGLGPLFVLCPPGPPSETERRNNADKMGTSVAFQNVTEIAVFRLA